MGMYKDNQDRVDAYLRGEMSQEERTKFESDLKTDVTLHDDFIFTKAISEAISDRKRKLDLMARWDAEEKLSLKLLHRRKMVRKWAIGISAIACIAIGFFSVQLVFLATSPSPNSDFVMPSFGAEVYYRSGDNSIENLDSLITAKDYEKALAYADSLILDYDNDLRQYKTKDSLSEKEAYNKEIVEEALEDIEWRKANLLVSLGKTDEAKVCLKYIVDRDGVYKFPADSLLNTISCK